MKLKRIDFLFLSLIFLAGLYFSFFRLSELYSYNYDQERDYLAIKQMLDLRRPILIGPRVVSASGFYLGPWYYYCLLPFYLLFGANPLFGAYMAGFFNILTALGIFFLLKHKSSLTAFCFSLIWLTPLSHRMSWNVTFIPLFVLGLISLLLHKKPKLKHALLATFLLGLGINFHFQIIFFVPLIIFWLFHHRKSIELSFSSLFFLTLAFVSSYFPLLLFDLRHSFVNLQGAIRFFQQDSLSNTSQIDKFLFSFRNLTREFSFALPPLNQHAIYKYVLVPLLLFFFTIRSLKDKSFRWLVAIVYVSIIALFLYSQSFWPEYYQLSAVVTLFILLGLSLSSSKIGRLIVVVLMLSIVIPSIINLNRFTDGQSYFYKKSAMLYILESAKPNRPNIVNDFLLGEGYGFGTIREYYEDKSLPFVDNASYFVGYSSNPKHNSTMQTFGVFGVSLIKP